MVKGQHRARAILKASMNSLRVVTCAVTSRPSPFVCVLVSLALPCAMAPKANGHASCAEIPTSDRHESLFDSVRLRWFRMLTSGGG